LNLIISRFCDFQQKRRLDIDDAAYLILNCSGWMKLAASGNRPVEAAVEESCWRYFFIYKMTRIEAEFRG